MKKQKRKTVTNIIAKASTMIRKLKIQMQHLQMAKSILLIILCGNTPQLVIDVEDRNWRIERLK